MGYRISLGAMDGLKIKKNVICCYRNIDGSGDHHVNWNKPDSRWQIPHFLSNWDLDKTLKKQYASETGIIWAYIWDLKEKGGKTRGMDLIKLLYTYVWNCHNKTHYFAKYIATSKNRIT